MNREGQETLLIFSYGSLLDHRSASKTLSPKSMRTGRKAVALGVRRVFDRDIPIDPTHNWSTPCHPDSRAMLNVRATGNPDDRTNGILYTVRVEDIPALRKREHGYDLAPILVVMWDSYISGSRPKYVVAYTFHSPKESHYTSEGIYPRPGYYELVRDAIKERGPRFYDMWLESTYLSDESTPISEWENNVQSGDPRSRSESSHCLISP